MRQLTVLKDEAAARKFAAWLVVQNIEARADAEADGWSIWVIDEDQLPAARQHLAQFQADPNDPRFRNAQQQAAAIEREEQQKRERAQKNTIEMNRRWGTGGQVARSAPVVLAMIAISVVVFILTDWGEQAGPGVKSWVQFSSGIADFQKVDIDGQKMIRGIKTEAWKDVQAGQIWRLVTPMFLHFGVMHIVFNMMWLYDLGGQIESRIKSRWFVALVLLIAATSCVSQVVVDSWLEGTTLFPDIGNFGGMSGVNYGLFGFIFVRSYVLQDRSYFLHSTTSLLMFGWLLVCFASNYGVINLGLGSVANTAHVAGMLAGMALGYVPQLVRRA
ncbi:rhomboid family intramembrane serine protease [Anatilimnocola floriformis]|uniref:rhomboid family intramembrane serine protease n=1 Tax=Anatilimnocola floriformis TaxID=2948575 RepID=UPI0020C45D4D|nr:rhomboid family intramembrane serine protease [Anatilimnocola floriformis]